jgi:hypothetical protein
VEHWFEQQIALTNEWQRGLDTPPQSRLTAITDNLIRNIFEVRKMQSAKTEQGSQKSEAQAPVELTSEELGFVGGNGVGQGGSGGPVMGVGQGGTC